MTRKNNQTGRRPTAFTLDDERVHFSSEEPETAFQAGVSPAHGADDPEALPETHPPKKVSFGKWIAIGLGGLASLAIGLAIDSLVRDLFSRTEWLGWTGVGLASLAALGLFGLLVRETIALMRLGRIDHLRKSLIEAAENNDAKRAQSGLKDLIALYKNRPETAKGRHELSSHMREVIDGRDLVILAEQDLLAPLDQKARRIVMTSAKRVSVVTAISPRALIDLMAVLFENMRIIRQLSALYGGRPGTVGFLRLARQVAAHLAITGGMAAGESLASQVLGHGLAARLSARLGEGVVNGLLTARIGIAAITVCRPVPFVATDGPRISDFVGELASLSQDGKEERKS